MPSLFKKISTILSIAYTKHTVFSSVWMSGGLFFLYILTATPVGALTLGQAIDTTSQYIQQSIVDQQSTSSVTPVNNQQALEQAVTWMYNNKLTKFSTVEEFEPETTLTREAASKFFGVFAITMLERQEDPTQYTCDFSDRASAHQGLLINIQQACYLGLFKGSDGKFLPKQNLTNAQALTVLMKSVFGEQPKNKGNHFSDVYRQLAYTSMGDTYTAQNPFSLLASTPSQRDAGATRGDIAIFMYDVRESTTKDMK